jgi:hypothetical protein
MPDSAKVANQFAANELQALAVSLEGTTGEAGQILCCPPVHAAVSESAAVPSPTKRLIAPLLHVSSVAWFQGAALVAAALLVHGHGRLVICAIATISYGYAATSNDWETRGKHFG